MVKVQPSLLRLLLKVGMTRKNAVILLIVLRIHLWLKLRFLRQIRTGDVSWLRLVMLGLKI